MPARHAVVLDHDSCGSGLSPEHHALSQHLELLPSDQEPACQSEPASPSFLLRGGQNDASSPEGQASHQRSPVATSPTGGDACSRHGSSLLHSAGHPVPASQLRPAIEAIRGIAVPRLSIYPGRRLSHCCARRTMITADQPPPSELAISASVSSIAVAALLRNVPRSSRLSSMLSAFRFHFLEGIFEGDLSLSGKRIRQDGSSDPGDSII